MLTNKRSGKDRCSLGVVNVGFPLDLHVVLVGSEGSVGNHRSGEVLLRHLNSTGQKVVDHGDSGLEVEIEVFVDAVGVNGSNVAELSVDVSDLEFVEVEVEQEVLELEAVGGGSILEDQQSSALQILDAEVDSESHVALHLIRGEDSGGCLSGVDVEFHRGILSVGSDQSRQEVLQGRSGQSERCSGG